MSGSGTAHATLRAMKRLGKRLWLVNALAAAVVVLIVLVVAACGGSSKSSATTTASSVQAVQEWANGLCTATNTYVSSLSSMADSLKGGNLGKGTLDDLVSQAKTSTQTFADSIKNLETPDVSDSKAKQIFETLQSQRSDDADAIKKATSNVSDAADVLQAVSVVTTTLGKARTQVTDAYSQAKQLDTKDNVAQAFKSAPACKGLIGS
jgi:prophage DNA circulation protein